MMSLSGATRLAAATAALLLWLALLLGTSAFPAGALCAASLFGLGLVRPRFALGLLLVLAALSPLPAILGAIGWFSPAEGGLWGLWAAYAWRERSSPRRPYDLPGTVSAAFGAYAALSCCALLFRGGTAPASLWTALARLPELESGAPLYGLRATSLLLEGLLAFHLARRLDSDPQPAKATVWGLWTGGTLAAASFFLFFLPRLADPLHNWASYRAALTFRDPESASAFGLLVLGAGLALASKRARFPLLYLLPGILVLFFTGSRTANFIALAGALGLAFYAGVTRLRLARPDVSEDELARSPAVLPALLAGALALLLLLFPSPSKRRYLDLVVPHRLVDQGLADRLDLWEPALRLLGEFPLSGIGPGEFTYALGGRPAVGHPGAPASARCYPLQLAVEYGLPALGLWLGLLVVVLLPGFRNWRYLPPETAALLLGIAFYLVHCLTSDPLLLLEHQLFFWSALGALAGRFSRVADRGEGPVARLLCAICLAVPLWAAFQPLPAPPSTGAPRPSHGVAVPSPGNGPPTVP